MASGGKRFNLKPPFDSVETRLPVEALISEEKYKLQRDLFLQGFANVQQKKFDDPGSFYAVAGIHGLPDGYCQHGTILFPTWHRAYVSLLEMLIYNEAKSIVDSYPDCDKKKEYKNELKKVRFPYWDWASPSVLCQGIPSVLFQELIDVETLQEADDEGVVEVTITIRNPLRAYTLPQDLGILKLVGDTSNPTQRPYIPDERTYPYTPVGYATVRHPDKDYLSDVNSTGLDIITSCSSTFRPSVWHLFKSVTEWKYFSNHSSEAEKQTEEYMTYSSIEGVHDIVHIKIGGTGGHMSYVETAGFDPIFFLHHANVDRLTAIWQACYPNSWMIGDGKRDENTSLEPFYNEDKGRYWNSKDIRKVKDLKYTYPELKETDPVTLLEDMLTYYQPIPNPVPTSHIYKVSISVKKKNYINTSFEIRAFIDLPDSSASTPVTSPHFAGSMSIFARDGTTPCATCDENSGKFVNGNIDITTCMQRLRLINENNKKEWGPYNPDKPENDGKTLQDRITLISVLMDGSKISNKRTGLKEAHSWQLRINKDDENAGPIEHKKLGPIQIKH
ncbi:hypothetical protein RclHR1_08390007 [Rhizophagus clarus]|uniref:tyrosinase n=1 Tax=Rhizophagus clarus TaxID=94130 RepID=A0A2Z6S775_9GLOM|nr:hypothetical protein RclHR1_08390007 [Rhizophagus clarus]GET04145.1 di-copper centre-containing protein [Rhizophagus clarus]